MIAISFLERNILRGPPSLSPNTSRGAPSYIARGMYLIDFLGIDFAPPDCGRGTGPF